MTTNIEQCSSDYIEFSVNGELQKVNAKYPFSFTLNDYLRDVLHLTGTKYRCKEGSCGCCTLNGRRFSNLSKQYENVSICSCIFPLYLCNKWEFTTIEGVKSQQKNEVHPIQKRLADYNGSQCGYCSTGMVMSMYNLLLNNPKPDLPFIENSLDGNICRCTGYRAILDAFKSFSVDNKPIDIEDLNQLPCIFTNESCTKSKHRRVELRDKNQMWLIPTNLNEFYDLLASYKEKSYKIISGNTGIGLFRDHYNYNVFISIQDLNELDYATITNICLSIGSRATIARLIDIFNEKSNQNGFEYLRVFSEHLKKFGNKSIRNLATWSGNLALKRKYKNYVSDIHLIFELIDAKLNVLRVDGHRNEMVSLSLNEYLNRDIHETLFIHSVELPTFDRSKIIFKLFKTMPRSQSTRSYLIAGFCFTLDKAKSYVDKRPVILFSGINSNFLHAVKTEEFLMSKHLNEQNVLNETFRILDSEIEPDNDAFCDNMYRKSLACSLLYKFFIEILNSVVDAKYKSASESIHDLRIVSSGKQNYKAIPDLFPNMKPMSKISSYLQTSGKIKYTVDSIIPDQLVGEFITTTIARGQLDGIDASDAENEPGVVRILFAKDIPGFNCINEGNPDEPLFCDDEVSFAGQPVGLVIAHTKEQAKNCVKKVKINYKNVKKPILTIDDAIKENSFFSPQPLCKFVYGDAKSAIESSTHRIKGAINFGTQCHFYMEPMIAICSPTEDGYKVDCTTQWIDCVQMGICNILGLKNASCLDIQVKQLGGAFGGKITRTNIVASAAALGALYCQKPVKVCLDLKDNLSIIGKRCPWYIEYEVGFDETGKLLGVSYNWYIDEGYLPNATIVRDMGDFFPYFENSYSCANWDINVRSIRTNTPANTFVRAPCILAVLSAIEFIMDNIAKHLNLDPYFVRINNLYKKGEIAPYGYELKYFNADEIMNNLRKECDYEARLATVKEFNRLNRWKKRGIYMIPLKYSAFLRLGYYSVMISIFNHDGSVAICNGGIEMGQGIHTKVAQIVAHEFSIDINLISVRPTSNFVNVNSNWTAASITSELVCECALECCKILKENLEPVRALMQNGYTWKELIAKAFQMRVDLSARYWINPNSNSKFPNYDAYGAACTEVLVDILTGEIEILRTDIHYDNGQSINGLIDVGQAEGAFVFGLGFWFYESFAYDENTGMALAENMRQYVLPSAKDIPIDFRVTLLNDKPNLATKLRTKFISEQPIIFSVSALLAVKEAIYSARNDAGNYESFNMPSPATVQVIQKLSLVNHSDFKI